jgi:hypothetical protein
MEGIGVQESPSEILGRRLPLLMEIEDETERLKQAYDLFVELNIPESDWLTWAQPLVDTTIMLQSDGSGKVTGLMIA